MNPSSGMPDWMPSNSQAALSAPEKASAISTSGRPLLGGSKDKMQAVPDFATILDHYAKNKKKNLSASSIRISPRASRPVQISSSSRNGSFGRSTSA